MSNYSMQFAMLVLATRNRAMVSCHLHFYRNEVMKLNAEAWSFQGTKMSFNSPSPLGMDKPPVLVQFSLVHGGVGNLV